MEHICSHECLSAYFDGILMVLVRRPYDVGDRISVSPVDEDADVNGSQPWIVEKLDLYSTTVRLAATRKCNRIAKSQ